MKSVLLHICCAGCATVCIDRLQKEGFKVSGLFYNPNIHPEQEYSRRKKDLDAISKNFSLQIIEGKYDVDNWFKFIQGYEKDKEGGKRCSLCFELRLKVVYQTTLREGFDFFTTTLTISPHKNSRIINEIGACIGGTRYLVRDFKKQDGFKQSVTLSGQLGLYRQKYCGCVFSQRS